MVLDTLEDLKACPFCGGKPGDRGFRRWECGSCGAQGPAGTKRQATEGWNRRVSSRVESSAHPKSPAGGEGPANMEHFEK